MTTKQPKAKIRKPTGGIEDGPDPDYQPLAETDYCVIDVRQVVFSSSRIGEAIAYMLGSKRGVLAAIMKNRP